MLRSKFTSWHQLCKYRQGEHELMPGFVALGEQNSETVGLIAWLGVHDTGGFFHSCYTLFSCHDSTYLH